MRSIAWEKIIDAREQTVNQLAEAAYARDLQLSDWGFLGFDRNSGGGGFLWFSDRQALFAFIGDHGAFFPASYEPNAFMVSQVTQAITANMQHGFLDDTAAIERLNVALQHTTKIKWFGSFASLCNDDTSFAREVRTWYYDRCDTDCDDTFAPHSEPIPADDRADFAEALQEYGA